MDGPSKNNQIPQIIKELYRLGVSIANIEIITENKYKAANHIDIDYIAALPIDRSSVSILSIDESKGKIVLNGQFRVAIENPKEGEALVHFDREDFTMIITRVDSSLQLMRSGT